jgi:hypothetical protein
MSDQEGVLRPPGLVNCHGFFEADMPYIAYGQLMS